MDGLSIIGIALGVGVIVYALSLRPPGDAARGQTLPPAPDTRASRSAWLRERPPIATGPDLGFGGEPATQTPVEPESFVYVPVLSSTGPRWRTRVGGVVGLMAVVVIAAVAVAYGIYQLGHLLNEMVQGFLGN